MLLNIIFQSLENVRENDLTQSFNNAGLGGASAVPRDPFFDREGVIDQFR